MTGPEELPYLPRHLVYARILPLLGIDLRLALRVPPGRLDLTPFGAVDRCLASRARATRHSPGSKLTWVTFALGGRGSRLLVYRASDGSRGCDLVWRKGRGLLLHEYQ